MRHLKSYDEYIDVMNNVGKYYKEPASTRNPFDYDANETLIKSITESYGKVLDTAGLNVTDNLTTRMKFFNRFGDRSGVDSPKPTRSYCFITRPDLNFGNAANIATIPFFEYMLQSKLGKSMMGYLQYPGRSIADNDMKVDSNFHPLMTNMAIETGGGKDLVMEKYDIEPNLRGDQLTYASGADGIYSIGEVPVTFQDGYNSPLFNTFLLWFLYIHHVARGDITTRRINIIEKIIDYTSSIYIFVLGPDGKTIIRFGKYTGCFPISVPMSTIQHNKELNADSFKELPITFAFNRYEPMNPEIFTDFNLVSAEFALEGGKGEYLDQFTSTLNFKNKKFPDSLVNLNGKRTYSDLEKYPWASHPFILDNKLEWF